MNKKAYNKDKKREREETKNEDKRRAEESNHRDGEQ